MGICVNRLIRIQDRGQVCWCPTAAPGVDRGTDPGLIATVAGLARRAALAHRASGLEGEAVRREVTAALRRALVPEPMDAWAEESMMAAAEREIELGLGGIVP